MFPAKIAIVSPIPWRVPNSVTCRCLKNVPKASAARQEDWLACSLINPVQDAWPCCRNSCQICFNPFSCQESIGGTWLGLAGHACGSPAAIGIADGCGASASRPTIIEIWHRQTSTDLASTDLDWPPTGHFAASGRPHQGTATSFNVKPCGSLADATSRRSWRSGISMTLVSSSLKRSVTAVKTFSGLSTRST